MHGHAAEKSENDDTGSERRKRHEYDSADHFVLHRIRFAVYSDIVQMKSFNASYSRLRRQGRVAIGKSKGFLRAGAIAMFAIDGSGMILDGSYMQGVTVFARFRNLKGFEGTDVGNIQPEDCRKLHLAKPLEKAVLEASSNYNILMTGGEIPEEPAPLTKIVNMFGRKKAQHIK